MSMESNLEITNLITPIINTYKILSNEWKNIFKVGISDYLYSQTEKYYLTNTFIHRSERVRFYDIYYPIKATYRNLTTDFEDFNEVLENYKNITIIGSAGSGKTTLSRYIFLNSIKTVGKIPILIELRSLNQYDGNFEKLLSEKVLKSNLKPSEETFLRTLKSGKFLFLLDGYDEIFSNKKQELNRQIEQFVDSYSYNNFVITTRPGSGIENFPRFYDFKVESLSDEDVKGFISKIVNSEERKNRIYEILQESKNQTYLDYLKNPLLLSMFILAFESHPEIPSRKSSFYRNVFDTLYSRHDGYTKNSWPREKLTKFEREDFENILKIFSYLTYIKGQYSFTNEYMTDAFNKILKSINLKCRTEDLVYDLQTTISILVLDGFEYHFPHRSMQEYFTAQFLATLQSDKKQKGYDNLVESFKVKSTDFSFHFWNLCEELDKFGFLTYFVIPQLKFYSNQISNDDEAKALDDYIQLIQPSFYSRKSGEIIIIRLHNFFSKLNEYCESYNHDWFDNFVNRSKVKDELLQHINLESNKINLEVINIVKVDSDMKSILISHGIGKNLRKIKKSIDDRIVFYQKQIAKVDNSIDKLLEL